MTPIDVGQGSQGTQAGQREGKHPADKDIPKWSPTTDLRLIQGIRVYPLST